MGTTLRLRTFSEADMGTTFGLSQADMARHLDNKQTVLCLVWDHVTDTQIAY